MSTNNTAVIAGVAAAFIAAGISLARMATTPPPAEAARETGPFRMFTQNESGRYAAGHDPQTQAGKPIASVYCFPRHPTAHVAGKQVELDVATNTVSLVVRGADGRVQMQSAAAELGTDIKAACTAIRRDADASDVVSRMAQRLML